MADPSQPRPQQRPAAAPSLALRARRLHAALAPVVLAPLLITVASGMGYRLLRDWGTLDRERLHWLMVLHEGEWLGSAGETVYVLVNGLGLAWMLGSGALMVWQRLRRT
ncbi:MAG: peptidase [Cyanobacteriota bacterium]|nr:peptidase [Cyanobacteriota bacterium]